MEKYDALQAQDDALQAQFAALIERHTELQDAHYDMTEELARIKSVCPPRDFETYEELSDWVDNHIKPERNTADKQYGEALKIQEEALADGYIISAWADQDTNCDTGESYYFIYAAAIAGGVSYTSGSPMKVN